MRLTRPLLPSKHREQPLAVTASCQTTARSRPQSWVHNGETGNRRVDIAEFCRWCQACNVDPMELLARYLGRKWPPSAQNRK